MKALALIDGEHYAPVLRDALAELPYDFAAAYLAGGTEKLRGICSELRLINHWSWRLWRIQGIWPASAPPPLPA